MSDQDPPPSSVVLYLTGDERTRIECRFENETIWLTQALIAPFQKDAHATNEHLVNIFEERASSPEASTIRKFRMVRREVARLVEHEHEWSSAVRKAKLETRPSGTLEQLEAEVKKLPRERKSKRPKS